MKKFLVLLVFIFISSSSFSQNIVYERVIKGKNLIWVDGKITRDDKVIPMEINITEIQDEFIKIQFGKRYHLLSTSKHKNIKISSHRKKKYWNVYDGDKLIPLQDDIDVLNFFEKYGFEYFKQNTKSSGATTNYMPNINFSITSIKSKSSITFKNNNN